MLLRKIFVLIFVVYTKVNAVPPEACFANFRWDDCGSPPVRVLYYYKPGSRCEVGIWRGCLPNLNMFKDEYECVDTCIFSARAEAGDYHILNKIEDETTTLTTTTDLGDFNSTDTSNTTDVTLAGNAADTGGTDSTGGTGDSGVTGGITNTGEVTGTTAAAPAE